MALDSEPVDLPSDTSAWQKLRSYIYTAGIVALCSLLGGLSHLCKLTDANIVMIFLAGVALAAARFGRGPALAAAILSVLVFDYFFVSPSFSFAIQDAQYAITLGVMLGIGLLISALTSKLQSQLRDSETKERRTAALYQITRRLSEASGLDALLETAETQFQEIFGGQMVLYICNSDGVLQLRQGENTAVGCDPSSIRLAELAMRENRNVQAVADDHALAGSLFVPMLGLNRKIGVLGVKPISITRFDDLEEARLLETCAGVVALSLERDRSINEAHRSQLQLQQSKSEVAAEQLRNSLLNAMSHDLRTPLATIAVTASSLLDSSSDNGVAAKREMLQTVVDESLRLGRQVENLLEMARLNSGVIAAHAEWEAIEELIESAIHRLRRELEGRNIHVQIDPSFPPLWVAGELMEKVFVNLLENAARYTPPGSTIEIQGHSQGEQAQIIVSDDGPGLPPGMESRVFEKYFRGRTTVADGQRGIGLGLAICRSVVNAHGGEIRAENRQPHGARFIISLPCETLHA